MRRIPAALLTLTALLLGLLGPAHAAEPNDLVVIVSAGSGVAALTREQAINIFMGRYRSLPSGLVAFPIDLGENSVERGLFYQRLVGKDLADVDAYWARLVFSGQTSPPLRVPDGRTAAA